MLWTLIHSHNILGKKKNCDAINILMMKKDI